MKRFFDFLIMLLPVIASAQSINNSHIESFNQGIQFENGLNWKQVLTKAKTENKIVFIDCYTTWCGPCKEMERSVYPLEKVGKYFNDKFISVKAQMDTSQKDDDAIKNWYADAHYIQEQYKVDAFPTFLFFTADGKLLNRATGAETADDFLGLAASVIDPKKQYYFVLDKFKQGKRDLSEMSYLAHTGVLLGDTAQSNEIAKEYVRHLKKEDCLTKSNIQFLNDFTKSSKDKGFDLFYRQADSINRVMDDDTYAQGLVQSIIYKEMVLPRLEELNSSSSSPDWNAIASAIQKKYNIYYAERLITAARTSWGGKHKNWPEYTKYMVLYMEKFGSKTNTGLMPSYTLNNYAWEIFQYSQDKKELMAALSWSSKAVMMHPTANWMDTYANILYKLGQDKLSTKWEEVAIKLAPDDKSIKTNLEKMKKGEPTWPVN